VLLILVATVPPVARVLLLTKDWLLEVVPRVGIAEYNARMYSRLTVDEVRLDRLTLTATAPGVSIAPACAEPILGRLRPAVKVGASVGMGYALGGDIMT
jgi:hypothetical protein